MGISSRLFGHCDPWVEGRSEAIIVAMASVDQDLSIGPFRRRRWLPDGSLARRSRGPLLGGLWLRVTTRWRSHDLDRRLAEGVDPMKSDELSLRVGQLGSHAMRVRFSSALRGAVEMAHGDRAPLFTTRLRLPEIREIEALLLTLADRLREGGPLGAQGLAMTARLVDDRSGPLYRPGADGPLSAAVLDALAALERGHLTAGTVWR